MRRAIVSILLIFFLGTMIAPPRAAEKGAPGPAEAAPLIASRPVALHPGDPSLDRIGALRWLGGWALTSRDPDFGGVSAMAVDGRRVIAVSDAGGVFEFTLGEDGVIGEARIAALRDGPAPEGGGPPRKRDRDAESMAFDPVARRMWIGFERANAIWRYGPGLVAQAHVEPAAMRRWPANGGPEAMVRLSDGRFFVLAEEAAAGGGATRGLIFAGDPLETSAEPLRFAYVPPQGFAPTDAAALPDGRLLILNRRFTMMEGPEAILTIADISALEEGSRLVGREIARLALPLTIDNMEALAVGEEAGRTIVWIASDDNFNAFQRTLLMRFELVEEMGEEKGDTN